MRDRECGQKNGNTEGKEGLTRRGLGLPGISWKEMQHKRGRREPVLEERRRGRGFTQTTQDDKDKVRWPGVLRGGVPASEIHETPAARRPFI